MGIFLAGAGPDPVAFPEVFDRFAGDLQRHVAHGLIPRIAVAVHHSGGNPQDLVAAYAEPLKDRVECVIEAVLLEPGRTLYPATFDGVNGIVVGGGLTPGYWDGLHPAAGALSRLAAAGTPYLGFSAGAMVAPSRALIGGYLINGVEVCGEECSEGLDPVDVRDGLGLVPFAVDVHAAQAGTLSRAVGAVAAGMVERAVAIDEDTALLVESAGQEDFTVIGTGNCWDVRQTNGGTVVSVHAAR